jgi:hypothetical protein
MNTDNTDNGDITMLLIQESLALARVRERHPAVVERRRQADLARRLVAARRLQRRAESASRRARALLAGV